MSASAVLNAPPRGALPATVMSLLAVCFAALLCQSLLVSAAFSHSIASAQIFPNSDYMMNDQINAVLTQVYKMSPSDFDPNKFSAALANFYISANVASGLSTVELLEWCAWPNSSRTMSGKGITAYCVNGASTESLSAASYVLTTYKLFSTDAKAFELSVSLASPYQEPVDKAPLFSSVDPSLYDPDTINDNGVDNGYVISVTRNSVAFWVIFGCLVGALVIAAIGLALLRCYRDRKQRERNTGMVRTVLHQYDRERTSFVQSFLGSIGVKKSRHKNSSKKSRHYGVENPNSIRSKYDVASAGFEAREEDEQVRGMPSTAVAAMRPTSRAAAYWPSADNDEREMDERNAGGRFR